MEKILLLLNSHLADVNTLNFACRIALLTKSTVTGLFIEEDVSEAVSFPETEGSYFQNSSDVSAIQNKMVKMDKDQCLRFFTENCNKRGVESEVIIDKGEPVEEVVYESRFADLVITHSATSSGKNGGGKPGKFVKEVLNVAECPVIVAPEVYEKTEEIIFCYDGSQSAVFAMKQFTYLFSVFKSKKVTVLKINEDPELGQEDADQKVLSWLKAHYSIVHFHILEGNVREELIRFLVKKKNAFVVMGAYGRSKLSYLITPGTAEELIRLVDLPVFVTHH